MPRTNELDLSTKRGLKKKQTKKDVNDMFRCNSLRALEEGRYCTGTSCEYSVNISVNYIRIVLLPTESRRVNWIFVFPSLESLSEIISSCCFSLS